MLKAIDTLRPPLVVAENVRGLLSAKADSDVEPCPWCVGDDGSGTMRALGAVLADLADIGFDASWTSLQAADVGAAHGRFRVFILAWPVEDVPTVVPDSGGARGEGRSGGGLQQGWQSDGGGAGDVTLLPTPTTREGKGSTIHSGGNLTLEGTVEGIYPRDIERFEQAGRRVRVEDMLPTARMRGGDVELLPTPVADNSRGLVLDSTEFQSLPNEVAYRWGQYADAIARWESVIGRPAPTPTEPGTKGNPRLSPRFVEFLMGLPAGHVTDPAIGLTRNQQLKALGNGVVPAQGAAALRHLLDIRNSDLSHPWKVAA